MEEREQVQGWRRRGPRRKSWATESMIRGAILLILMFILLSHGCLFGEWFWWNCCQIFFLNNCWACFKLNSTQMGEESCSADFSLEESRRYVDISYFFCICHIVYVCIFWGLCLDKESSRHCLKRTFAGLTSPGAIFLDSCKNSSIIFLDSC